MKPSTTRATPPGPARRLVEAGLVDRDFCLAQTGRAFASDLEAARAFVAAPQAWSPHPLLDRGSLPLRVRAGLEEGAVGPLLRFLTRAGTTRRLSPLFAASEAPGTDAEKAAHPGGALGLFLATAGPDTLLPGGRGLTWGRARGLLLDHARLVHATRAGSGAGEGAADASAVVADRPRREATARVDGRLSVLVVVQVEAVRALRAVESVLRTTPGVDVEVVVVDNGSPSDMAMTLAAGLLGDERRHLVRLPRTVALAHARNTAFARSTGEHVVFLDPTAEPRSGWWEPLVRHLADDRVLGAQPLLLNPDDTIWSAGTVFWDDPPSPCPYLAGHPAEDALKIRETGVPAASAAALLLRAVDVAELGGFDPEVESATSDVDLCLRAGRLRRGHFVVEPASRVTQHAGMTPGPTAEHDRLSLRERWAEAVPQPDPRRWTEAGFVPVQRDAGPGLPHLGPLVGRAPVAVLPDGMPALRWALKIAAPGGDRGDRWGDVHFARSLARALEARGQDAVLFRHGAHRVAATELDDVVLGLRGLDPIQPVPGQVNAVWVISHPEDVTANELLDFDLVYAASASWARQMTERTGRTVSPLLQATDTTLRPDTRSPVGDGSRPLFVGNTHAGRPRQIVLDAVAAGVPVEVHGPGWEGILPAGHLRSPYVANHALMALYRAHGLVLADHWGDMATHGFLANRLFDAVAAGARVICDPVPGTDELLGAVQVYRSPEELAFLCSPEARSRWPSDAQMVAIAEEVAAAHSFDRRADQLLVAAAGHWRGRQR